MIQMTLEEKTELEAVVETIKKTVKTKEIYLFGSYARGEQRKHSDFDVFVVLEDDEPRRRIECLQDIHCACYDIITKGLDVLSDYDSSFQVDNFGVTKIVKQEGVKLYG